MLNKKFADCVPGIQSRMANTAEIGIIGDFNRDFHTHWAIEAALHHSAERLEVGVKMRWIPTTEIAERGGEALLTSFDGLWASPGSPYASLDGMLAAIKFARNSRKPFLGTCGGFQYSLIELTRNVLGLAGADTAENNSGLPAGRHGSKNIVITPVACALPGRHPGGPKMSGDDAIRPVPGTLLAALCGDRELRGEYFCNFEVNADYIPRWEAAGLRIAGRGPQGEMRAFDLPSKRFHLATLFQPQLSSTIEQPHPIVTGFLRACIE
jgi:CTP synthase (UTP-ammonia lyase)